MLKKETQNTFASGLVMDFDPLQAQSNTLVNCLNGTLITHNGNELSLQNDMGNGRVETAYLPEGYVPLGTTELGGIIYIVSYNPLTDRCQIGSFPSPERNITTDETGDSNKSFVLQYFLSDTFSSASWSTEAMIQSPYVKLVLYDSELNPGDKFQISCAELAKVDYVSAYGEMNKFNPDLLPRYLKLNVVSISDSGKITNLNDTLVWQETTKSGYYYIREDDITSNDGSEVDLDEYRNLVGSNYNVFSSKTSGKLGVLAELECIDTFECTWDAICAETASDGKKTWNFYLFLNWTYENESSPDKINLYGIRYDYQFDGADGSESGEILISDYPSSEYASGTQMDIMQNEVNGSEDDYNIVYYTPYYVDSIDSEPDYAGNGEITKARKNDGSDNQYLLYDPIEVTYDPTSADSVINLDIYPCMPFGTLEWLKQSFTIDLSKLGTGDITLEQYKYYNTTEKTTFAWALAAYPERGKEIKEVAFNFYEITSGVYSWIVGNEKYLDDDRIVDGSWESANVTASSFTGTVKNPFTVEQKSSYSGHFTNTFTISGTDLEWGKTYLVEIAINYNDEKTIKYYRIYYATTIFNDSYYSVTDFKDIVLEDVLSENLSFGNQDLKITNEQHNKDNDYQLAIYDSSGNQVDEIPQTNETQLSSYTQYHYQEAYEADVDFSIVGTESSGTFDVLIEDISPNGSTKYEVETDFSNDSEEELQTNGGSIASSSLGLDPISEDVTWSSVTVSTKDGVSQFSGSLKLLIDIPIQLNYTNKEQYNIQYQQKELEVKTGWILTNFGDKASRTIYSTEILKYNESTFDPQVKVKDHSVGTYSIHEVFFDENIAEELKDCDVLILASAKTTNTDNVPRYGWYKGTSTSTYIKYKGNTLSKSTTNIMYVMLDSYGNTVYFTYAATYSSSYKTWCGLSKWTTVNEKTWSNTYLPFNLYQNDVTSSDGITLDSSKLKKPLEYINKLVEYNGDQDYLYEWGNINYWDTFTWTLVNCVICDIDIKLRINDNVELESSDSIKNFQYTSKREENSFQWTMTDRIIMTTYIQLITSVDSSLVYYLDLDGKPQKIESSSIVLDVSGSEVTEATGIKPYYNDTTGNTGTAKIKLSKSGDYVRISKNEATSCMYESTTSGCTLRLSGIYLIT